MSQQWHNCHNNINLISWCWPVILCFKIDVELGANFNNYNINNSGGYNSAISNECTRKYSLEFHTQLYKTHIKEQILLKDQLPV